MQAVVSRCASLFVVKKADRLPVLMHYLSIERQRRIIHKCAHRMSSYSARLKAEIFMRALAY